MVQGTTIWWWRQKHDKYVKLHTNFRMRKIRTIDTQQQPSKMANTCIDGNILQLPPLPQCNRPSSLLSTMSTTCHRSLDIYSPHSGQSGPNFVLSNHNSEGKLSPLTSDHNDLTAYVLQIINNAQNIIHPEEQHPVDGLQSSSNSNTPIIPFDLTVLEPTPISPDATVLPLLPSCKSSLGLSLPSSMPAESFLPPHQLPSTSDQPAWFSLSTLCCSDSALESVDCTVDSSCPYQRNKQGRQFRDYEADQWIERFTELLQFKRFNGHCLVPHTYPPNPLLSQWVKRQRYQHKLKALNRHSTLTDDRQQMLEMAGFIWHCHQASWYEKLDALQRYRALHGDCRVSPNYHHKSLAVWVKCQRRQWKLFRKGERCSITKERIVILNKMGFEWNPRGL